MPLVSFVTVPVSFFGYTSGFLFTGGVTSHSVMISHFVITCT